MKRTVFKAQNRGARGSSKKSEEPAAEPGGVKAATARTNAPAALLKERFDGSGPRRVSFYYTNPNAIEVHVAGTFNGWQPGAAPMHPLGGGAWSVDILLDPGSHEYLFLVDGRWEDNPVAARRVPNPFGGMNCVVEIESGRPRRAGL